jgi:hypothetical protein
MNDLSMPVMPIFLNECSNPADPTMTNNMQLLYVFARRKIYIQQVEPIKRLFCMRRLLNRAMVPEK